MCQYFTIWQYSEICETTYFLLGLLDEIQYYTKKTNRICVYTVKGAPLSLFSTLRLMAVRRFMISMIFSSFFTL